MYIVRTIVKRGKQRIKLKIEEIEEIARIYEKVRREVKKTEFISYLKQSEGDISEENLKEIIEARCYITGEDKEEILRALNKNSKKV